MKRFWHFFSRLLPQRKLTEKDLELIQMMDRMQYWIDKPTEFWEAINKNRESGVALGYQNTPGGSQSIALGINAIAEKDK